MAGTIRASKSPSTSTSTPSNHTPYGYSQNNNSYDNNNGYSNSNNKNNDNNYNYDNDNNYDNSSNNNNLTAPSPFSDNDSKESRSNPSWRKPYNTTSPVDNKKR